MVTFDPEYEEEFYDEMDRLMRKAYKDSHHKDPIYYKGYFLYYRKKRITIPEFEEIKEWYEEEVNSTISYDQNHNLIFSDREYPEDPILRKEFKFRDKLIRDAEEREQRMREEAEEEKAKRFLEYWDERERYEKERAEWEKEHPNWRDDYFCF